MSPMHLTETVAETRAWLEGTPRPLGLVPTMGFLHQGHLSLVREARRQNQTVAVSVFVNPTQFGPSEDFAAYPRDLERDLDLLRAEGVDLVYAPTPAEVYPDGFDTYVVVGSVTERLEGSARPGHFRGVATVVAKLFNVLQPERAYFGQKDGQQVVVVRKMVADLDLPVEVIALPTVREPDGLAMSSRNVYLSAPEREAALSLSRALRAVETLYQRGERNAELLRAILREVVGREPLASLDYVSVADARTLDELAVVDRPAMVSLAARIGRARLIDNILLPGS